MGTGEIILFGSDVQRKDGTIPTVQGAEASEEPIHFTFPMEMGAVNVRRLCGGSVLLLDCGHTFRLDERQGFHSGFAGLTTLESTIIDIAIGGGHFLALSETGQVYAFGGNAFGQLGLGHTRMEEVPTLIHKFSQLKAKVVQVACGKFHSVALTADGQVYTWGQGSDFQTGLSKTSTEPTLTPRYLAHLNQPVALITAGQCFTAAVTQGGEMYTWGSGLYKKKQRLPEQVIFPGGAPIVSVAGGFTHVAAVAANGRLYTWGLGSHGQLGHDTDMCKTENPMMVQAVKDKHMVRVFSGDHYVVAIDDAGCVYSFGSAIGGKLGHGDSQHQFVPRKITSIENLPVVEVGCGKDRLVCFIPTRITSVSPSCAPVSGGTLLTMTGMGMYSTGDDYYVRMTLETGSVTTRGQFDPATGVVTCKMPSLPEKLSQAVASGEIHPIAKLSLSLDGCSYTNQFDLNVFALPSTDVASLLEPSCGPYQGGTVCTLQAKFQNIPYDDIKVKFSVEASPDNPAQEVVVPASYCSSSSTLHFKSAPFGPNKDKTVSGEWPTLIVARVSVSLEGQHFAPIGNAFSYYGPSVSVINPYAVGLKGGPIQLTCSGVHFQDDIEIRFTVNDNPSRVFTCKSEFRTKDMFAEHDAAVVEQKDGCGYLWVLSPSFEHYGSCSVTLAVCLNGRDFTVLEPKLKVSSPWLQALLPACGPVKGGTTVLLQGEFLFYTKEIHVKMLNAPLEKEVSAEAEPSTEEIRLPLSKEIETFGEYRDRFGSPVVEILAPEALHPGLTHLFCAFNPKQNAFSTKPLLYTYYTDPVVHAADPSTITLEGGVTVELRGTGFIDSTTMTVRLVEILEEAVAGKGKKGAPKKGKKADVSEEAAEDPNAEVKVKAACLLNASFKDNTPAEGEAVEAVKGKPKGKAKGPGNPADAYLPSILFTSPPVALLLAEQSPKQEILDSDAVPGNGMEVEIELSLNGQQFVSTGVRLRFEAESGKNGSKSGKKKK